MKSEGRSRSESRVTGLASCSATGCHGSQAKEASLSDSSQQWRSAYSVWASEDPHRGAFEVLYARRSIEIYLNLHPSEKLAGSSPDDDAYFKFLEKRCIGCHATALTGDTSIPQPGQAKKPEEYLSGVSCESCHGVGRDWLQEHYMANWPGPEDVGRRSELARAGFQDTKNLHVRAAVCVGCHVGPQTSGTTVYDVNHDLIGAGHPRLTFEFNAYLINYPKHWHDLEASDDATHFHAWRIGQQQAARQSLHQLSQRLEGQASENPTAAPWPEFATFDCFHCHHAIKPPSEKNERVAKGSRRGGLPQPTMTALDNWILMRDDPASPASDVDELRQRLASWQPDADLLARVKKLHAHLSENSISPSPAPIIQNASLLLAMLERWNSNKQPSWDEAVQFYLALSALNTDLATEGDSPLNESTKQLYAALADGSHFGDIKDVTQYHSPTTFDATRLGSAFGQVRAALTQLKDMPPNSSLEGKAGN